jgi:hypothetical protein
MDQRGIFKETFEISFELKPRHLLRIRGSSIYSIFLKKPLKFRTELPIDFPRQFKVNHNISIGLGYIMTEVERYSVMIPLYSKKIRADQLI